MINKQRVTRQLFLFTAFSGMHIYGQDAADPYLQLSRDMVMRMQSHDEKYTTVSLVETLIMLKLGRITAHDYREYARFLSLAPYKQNFLDALVTDPDFKYADESSLKNVVRERPQDFDACIGWMYAIDLHFPQRMEDTIVLEHIKEGCYSPDKKEIFLSNTKKLLSLGYCIDSLRSPEGKSPLDGESREFRRSLLVSAAHNIDFGHVKLFLESGANVNQVDQKEQTALSLINLILAKGRPFMSTQLSRTENGIPLYVSHSDYELLPEAKRPEAIAIRDLLLAHGATDSLVQDGE